MCNRWVNDFSAFLADMGPAPEGASLDRIDNDRGYEPDNCQWTNRLVQANKKTNNRIVTVNGTAMSLADAVRTLGLHYGTINSRIQRGWDPTRALTEPLTPTHIQARRAGLARHGIPYDV